jgi:hypothetical protein
MKAIITLTLIGISVLLGSSCQQSDAASNTSEKPPENAAKFKAGEGVSLSDEMKKSIGFEIAEVGEEKIETSIALELSAMNARTLRGSIPATSAASIKAGMEVEITANKANPAVKGSVEKIEKALFGMPVDLEITITTQSSIPTPGHLLGKIRVPADSAVTAVPVSALLKTAEGAFVYTVNGQFYIRTPVKTGATNDHFVEITDGLYSGDQIVTTPVMSLWMAELQILRGGKSCTCGH